MGLYTQTAAETKLTGLAFLARRYEADTEHKAQMLVILVAPPSPELVEEKRLARKSAHWAESIHKDIRCYVLTPQEIVELTCARLHGFTQTPRVISNQFEDVLLQKLNEENIGGSRRDANARD
jgi:hypothetical protein